MQTAFTNTTETICVYLKYIQLYYDLCMYTLHYVITPRTVATTLLTFQVNLLGKQYLQLQ